MLTSEQNQQIIPTAIGLTFNWGIIGVAFERFDLATIGTGMVALGVAASTALWQVGSTRNRIRKESDALARENWAADAEAKRLDQKERAEGDLVIERKRHEDELAIRREELKFKREEGDLLREVNLAEIAEVKKTLALIVQQLEDARSLAAAQKRIAEHSDALARELKESLEKARKNQHELRDQMATIMAKHEEEKLDYKQSLDAQYRGVIEKMTSQIADLNSRLVTRVSDNTGRIDQIEVGTRPTA